MDQTHITIKFTPFVKNIDEHCTLEIVPEVTSLENTGSIDWDGGEHLEYNIPVLHKIIIKKHSKDLFVYNKVLMLNDIENTEKFQHEQNFKWNNPVERKILSKDIKDEILNGIPLTEEILHVVDLENKERDVQQKKLEVNTAHKNILENNIDTSSKCIDGVYSAGDGIMDKTKRQTQSKVEVHDFKPTYSDVVGKRNYRCEGMSADKEIYSQIIGSSTDMTTDKVAFYKQLLRNELMPLRLEMDRIVNKCENLCFVPYNTFSEPITRGRVQCGSNRFVYTVIAEG